jgi:hypothetical protein
VTTIRIVGPDQLAKALKAVAELAKEEPDTHEVIVRKRKRNISDEQRGVYWKWLTVMGKDLGSTKDELHFEFKRDKLVKIYERDDLEYAAMIRTIRSLDKDTRNQMWRKVVKLTSIRDASVEQMTEYMNDIKSVANDLRIALPEPNVDWW